MKKPTIKALIKKADDAFQTMVRYRDNFRCITCGRQFPFGERTNLHAGHFVGRGNKSVRWDEENVNAQCAYCNMQQSFGNVFVCVCARVCVCELVCVRARAHVRKEGGKERMRMKKTGRAQRGKLQKTTGKVRYSFRFLIFFL